jgi:hypothetical protein
MGLWNAGFVTEVSGIGDTLLAIARGEQPVQNLDSMGLTFSGSTGRRVLHSPSGMPVVPVSWQDLAVGFLRHHGQDTLEEWASFVVMADYEFPEDRGNDAERFLEALHDAANEWPLPSDVEELAQRLSAGRPRSIAAPDPAIRDRWLV